VTLVVGLAWAAGAQQFETVPKAKEAQATPAAPASPAGRIGVINIQGAMGRTQEGRKASEDMQAYFAPKQAELEKLRQEISNLENQLRTQERTLSNEARMQLTRQMEQKRKEGERRQQDLSEEVEQTQQDHLNRIGERMQRIISQYAQEKNLSIVLNAVYWFQGGPFVYANQAVDITEEIVQAYDKAHPAQAGAGSSQLTAPDPSRPAQQPPGNPRP
jgi:Skp family chaperone for outer membrane proteins